MLSRFPCGPGVSFTVAPSAVTRSVNTFLKLCSRCDSGLGSAGSCVGQRPAHLRGRLGVRRAGGQDRPQVPLRGRPGHAAEVAARGERDEAPMAGQPLLVLAGAVADPFPGAVQQIPHPRRVRELGQVAGAARDHVVQQKRLAGRAVWPATGSLIAAMSMWSGLPPICSCRPSSSAAARLGIANWSPSVTDAAAGSPRPGSSGSGSARCCGRARRRPCGSGTRPGAPRGGWCRCSCRARRSPRRPGTAGQVPRSPAIWRLAP